MGQMGYHQKLNEMSATFSKQDYHQTLQAARHLKEELLLQKWPDPSMLGWSRWYEFKSLYRLEKYQDAYRLLSQPEPKPYTMSAKNSGLMYSIGAELAMRLDHLDGVILWGQRCLTTQLSCGDLASSLQCAATICELLHSMKHDQRNLDFVNYLLALGHEHNSEQAIFHGYRYMLAHVESCLDPQTIDELMAGIPTLQSFQSPDWKNEAIKLIKKITQSSWYKEALPSPEQQERAQRLTLHQAAATGDRLRTKQLLDEGVPIDVQQFSSHPSTHCEFSTPTR